MKLLNLLKSSIKRYFFVSIASFLRLIDNYGIEHAGYMSFMLLLSLFPAIVIFIAFTHVLQAPNLSLELLKLVELIFSNDTIKAIQDPINTLIKTPPQNLISIFLISYMWTSASFIEGIRTILNRIYNVENPPRYLSRRLLSIMQFMFMVCSIFVVLMVKFALPAVMSKLPMLQNCLQVFNLLKVNYIISFFILFCLVSAFYIVIPNKNIKSIQVIPGALITVSLWELSVLYYSKYFIYYTKMSIIYGSLGNIVLTLLLFYILSLIFIYGAEFNYSFFYVKNYKNTNNC
jgi:membrane protein